MKTSEIIERAVQARKQLSLLSTEKKNSALLAMAAAIEDSTGYILAENGKDMAAAKGRISEVKLDRLLLTEDRVKGMAAGIRDVVKLPDPVGRVITERVTADGLKLKKVGVPLGVIAIIYESRPNVTSDAAACVLRAEMSAYFAAGRKPMPPHMP